MRLTREKVPSSRVDLSMTGMCGAICFSLDQPDEASRATVSLPNLGRRNGFRSRDAARPRTPRITLFSTPAATLCRVHAVVRAVRACCPSGSRAACWWLSQSQVRRHRTQGSGPYAAALAAELVKNDLLMFHRVRVAVMDKTNGDQVPWTEDGIQRRERVLFGGEGQSTITSAPGVLQYATLTILTG